VQTKKDSLHEQPGEISQQLRESRPNPQVANFALYICKNNANKRQKRTLTGWAAGKELIKGV